MLHWGRVRNKKTENSIQQNPVDPARSEGQSRRSTPASGNVFHFDATRVDADSWDAPKAAIPAHGGNAGGLGHHPAVHALRKSGR